MRKFYLVIAGFIISFAAMAQEGSLIWQKCYGGSGADSARSIANTADGGYFIAGVTYSNDGNVTGNHNPTGNFSDVWVIKVNQSGGLVWQKTFGGSFQDQANSVFATNDGGAVIAGWTSSNDGDVTGLHGTAGAAADFWVIKIDASGALQWQKTFGGTGNDYAQSIQQTSDGGFIVAGSTFSNDGDVSGNHGSADFWVIKLNSAGALTWQKCFGGTAEDDAASVVQTNDGGYAVTGTTLSSDGNVTRGVLLSNSVADYWLIKLDGTGTLTWQNCFGGSHPSTATAVVQTTDNAYAMSGYTYANDENVSVNYGGSSGSTADNWLVKGGNTNGIMQWQNCWGGSLNDFAQNIKQTRDGHLIITGASTSTNGLISGNHGTQDLWTYEIKANGYPPAYWYGSFGGSANDAGFDVTESTDSDFVEVGTTNSTDGQVSGNHGSYDFWVIKIQSHEGAPGTAIDEVSSESGSMSVYPNPSHNFTTISVSDNLVGSWLELTDAIGKNISRQQITNSKFRVETGSLAKGVYLVRVAENGTSGLVKKLVIE